MSSSATDSTDSTQLASYEDILLEQIGRGLSELKRPTSGLALSSFSAGLDVGFGPLAMAIMFTLVGDVYGEPLTRILLANLYSIGFIFVIGGRSELFTEHTATAVFPVLDGRASLANLGRLWGAVYLGNIVGAAVFAIFAVFGTPTGLIEPAAFHELAVVYTGQSSTALFTGAVFAGWLMGLLSWLVASAQDSIGRLAVVWLVTTVIGFAHFPHSVAGTIEVLMGTIVDPAITPLDFGRFLLFATIGNALGGTVFVAVLRYGHVVRGGEMSAAEIEDEVIRED
jgi:formate/nitrite transporter FocA (FNT family)